MDGGDRGGRKERAISRVECNDVSTLPPSLTTFRLILSVRRKRSSRLAISQPVPILANLSWRIRAATLPFTLRLFRPFWRLLALGPSFYHETVPETEETTSRPSQKFIILSLTQQYLRHGSKLESISKKFISNAGIFSSFFLVLSFFLFISVSARFYLVSSCLQMHANGKRKNGEGRGLLYRANIFTNSRRAWPLLCRLWRRDYWLSIIWKWCLGIFNTLIFQNFWRWFRCWKGIIELNARFALTFGRTD